jgi:hypothetical protein
MTSPVLDGTFGQLYKLCDYWMTKFETDKGTLGIQDVYYGDQKQIPRTPSLCLEPDAKRRELAGVPRRVENTLGFYVLLYISKVTDVETNARDALVFAETVETYIHQDKDSGGYLVHGYCTDVEPGYRTRGDSKFRACRIKFEGINKTVLGM